MSYQRTESQELLTEPRKLPSRASSRNLDLAKKARTWASELLPRSRKFVGIEFDRNLLKFIVVDGYEVKDSVRFLKVKFLSSNDDHEMQKALLENLQEMELRSGQHVTISVPRHSVHTKLLRLPSHDREELRKMVTFHLQNEIPLPHQEVVSDFRIVDRQEDGFTRIMVVMARKHEIERYVRICKSAGLEVDAIRLNIEATYYSFVQFLRHLPEVQSKCMALVDVDFAATNVIIIDRGNLLFCRSVGKGVEELIERMVGPDRLRVYESWIDGLSRGVAATIAAFERENPALSVEHVALTGWLPRVKFLTHKLMANLTIPVSWFDLMIPLGHFTGRENDGVLHNWFSISTLLGMAGARHEHLMDLRPDEERQVQFRKSFVRQAVYTGLLLAYLLLFVFGTARFALHRRHVALADLKAKMVALHPKVQAVNRWKKVQRLIKAQLGRTERTTALLAQLFEKLPEEVELNSLTFLRGEGFILRGVADNLEELLDLPQQLAEQPAFGEVIISSADRHQQQGSMEEIEFEMKVHLRLSETP